MSLPDDDARSKMFGTEYNDNHVIPSLYFAEQKNEC
jgi:hypothetical protein